MWQNVYECGRMSMNVAECVWMWQKEFCMGVYECCIRNYFRKCVNVAQGIMHSWHSLSLAEVNICMDHVYEYGGTKYV